MDNIKTLAGVIWGGLVSFINIKTNLGIVNEGIGIAVGILTCVWLMFQIRKSLRKPKSDK